MTIDNIKQIWEGCMELRGVAPDKMKRLTTILCLSLFLTGGSQPLVGREPDQTSRKTAVSRSVPKKLVWDASPVEEGVSSYNVYEKIDNGRQPLFWKRIATVHKPSFTFRKPGPHVFAVTAVSKFGESPRSSEMVVTR
jgi:hypothetical protein